MDIYVGNLPYTTTNDDLRDMFAAHGQVARASVVSDRETGRSKGFGFVTMSNAAEAQKAIETLNQSEMNGRRLVVNEARPREPRRDGPPSRMGGGDRGDRGPRY